MVKNLPANAGDIEIQVRSLGQEDALEEGMATHSSILAWRIPWTEEPGGLWSIGSHRAGHDQNDLACRELFVIPSSPLCTPVKLRTRESVVKTGVGAIGWGQ